MFAHPITLAEKQWDWPKWKQHWEGADVLVLDETSMMDCDLIEEVGRTCMNQRVWGVGCCRLVAML